MIAAKAVIAHLIGAGVEVGNENAGVISAACRPTISPPVSESTRRSPARRASLRIDPTRLQCAKVRGSEVVADVARTTVLLKTEWFDQWRRTVPWIQILVVDIALARIHFSLLRVEGARPRFGKGCCKPTVSNTSVELWTVMGGGVWRKVRS